MLEKFGGMGEDGGGRRLLNILMRVIMMVIFIIVVIILGVGCLGKRFSFFSLFYSYFSILTLILFSSLLSSL